MCGVVISGAQNAILKGFITTKWGDRQPVRVLVDSGASRNMVSQRLARTLARTRVGHERSSHFRFANGTVFISDERCNNVHLQLQQYDTSLNLLVCKLADFDVILGREWLCETNPNIDWKTGTITIGTTPTQHQVTPVTDLHHIPTQQHPKQHVSANIVQQPDKEPDSKIPKPDTIKLELMSATQYRRMARKPHTIDSMAVLTPKTRTTCTTDPAPTSTLPLVRSVVDGFQDLFQPPQNLPPHRGSHDHRIDLVEGARAPFANPFRLSPDESVALAAELTLPARFYL